jgi:hypothetical protein
MGVEMKRRKNNEVERLGNGPNLDALFEPTLSFGVVAIGMAAMMLYIARLKNTKARCMAIYGAQHAGEGTPEEIADKAMKECKGYIFKP